MADPATTVDYYDLLGVSPAATESEIRRAYRKTSILYHPDKVEPTPANLDKFHQLQIALNTLTTPDEKAKYDQSREAKLRRKAENEALESRRRGLKEDLERAEAAATSNGVVHGVSTKRTWSEREVKINQIKEENRRRMAEMTARRAKEAGEARERVEKQQRERAERERMEAGVPEAELTVDRSVKVRWVKEGEGLEIDQHSIREEFPAGEVENVVLLKDKRRRVDGRKDKVTMGTAVVVFATLAAARKAMQKGPWEGIESIGWAKEKEEPA